jgi:small-conductance mechanosensitive channel
VNPFLEKQEMIAFFDAVMESVEPWLGLTGVPPERFATALVVTAFFTLTAPIAWRVAAFLTYRSLDGTEERMRAAITGTLQKPVRWAWVLAGLWTAKIALGPHINEHVAGAIVDLLRFGGVVVAGTLVFALANPASMWVQAQHDHRDGTYLWLFAPIVPNVLRLGGGGAILAEGAEVFLGVSPLGLAGVVGGASVAFGLLFNETARELMAAGILYHDDVFAVGDVILLRRDDEVAIVDRIGLRSTLLRRLGDGAHCRMPNTALVSGNVLNLSRSTKQTVLVRASLLAADTIEALCRAIIEQVGTCEGVAPDTVFARLVSIEGSERVILVSWEKVGTLSTGVVRHHAQLAVLRSFEQLDIPAAQVKVLRVEDHERPIPYRGRAA